MPPEAMCHGRYDATIQSDLPMDMASSRSYGENYLTKLLTSTFGAYFNGNVTRDKLAALQGNHSTTIEHNPRELALDWIAEHSSSVYKKVVRENDGALAFLNNAPDNKFRSSRSTARGGVTIFQDFDKVRAIPKEYLFGGADLQAHNVGLQSALKFFVKAHGDESLTEALKLPFAAAMTKTIRAGLTELDPTIARAHGEAYDIHAHHYKLPSGSADFVNGVLKEVDGLNTILDRHSDDKFNAGKVQPSVSGDHVFTARALDHIGHAIITTGLTSGKTARPNANIPGQKDWAESCDNSLFVTGQQIGHVNLREQVQERSVATVRG